MRGIESRKLIASSASTPSGTHEPARRLGAVFLVVEAPSGSHPWRLRRGHCSRYHQLGV